MFGKVTRLIIVCTEETRQYGSYLIQLISQKDDKNGNVIGIRDGAVEAVLWNEKEYESNRPILPSEEHVLFIGDSKLIQQETAHMNCIFNKYNMKFYSLGTKASMRVEKNLLSTDEYKEFSRFCANYHKNSSELRIQGSLALMGAGAGVLLSLLGPVGWAGVAVAGAIGASAGGILGNSIDKKSCVEDQYSFLTYYSYFEILPRFLEEK